MYNTSTKPHLVHKKPIIPADIEILISGRLANGAGLCAIHPTSENTCSPNFACWVFSDVGERVSILLVLFVCHYRVPHGLGTLLRVSHVLLRFSGGSPVGPQFPPEGRQPGFGLLRVLPRLLLRLLHVYEVPPFNRKLRTNYRSPRSQERRSYIRATGADVVTGREV